MTSTTIQLAVDRWLATTASASKATAANYRHAIHRFLSTANNQMDSVGAAAFISHLNQSKLSPASRASYISAVRSFFRFLAEEELIPKPPLAILKRPRISRSTVNYLKQQEAVKVLAQPNSDRITLTSLALLMGLGLRVSEAIGAQWSHLYEESVDTPKGKVQRIGLLIPNGKGGQSRIAAVPSPIFCMLQDMRRFRGRIPDLNRDDKTPILEHNGRPYTRQWIWKLINTVGATAGIQQRIGPHTLRHTFATLAAKAGAQPYDLQHALGHQKLETTMFYVHLQYQLDNETSNLVCNQIFGQLNNTIPKNVTDQNQF